MEKCVCPFYHSKKFHACIPSCARGQKKKKRRNAITSQTIELWTQRGMGTKIAWKLKAFFLAHGTATHTSDLFSLPRVPSCACVQCEQYFRMNDTVHSIHIYSSIGSMATAYAFVFHMNFFAARSLKMNWINLFTFHENWMANRPCTVAVWMMEKERIKEFARTFVGINRQTQTTGDGDKREFIF